jgi:heme oxygenase
MMTTPALVRKIGVALFGPQFQAELARSLNVTPRSVTRWLEGESEPTPERWKAMVALANTHAERLREVAEDIRFERIKAGPPRLLREIGRKLYGQQFHAPMIRALSINDRVFRRWLGGQLLPAAGVWRDLEQMLLSAPEQSNEIAALAALAARQAQDADSPQRVRETDSPL